MATSRDQDKIGISLKLFLPDVPAPVANFISLEMRDLVYWFGRIASLAASRHRTFIAMLGMEMIVDVAVKIGGSM